MNDTISNTTRACPKRERVIRDLRRYLEGPECPSNGRLPRETELAEHFGVTRRTLRFALDILEDEHLIERIHGKGTFRSGNDPSAQCIYFIVPCCDFALRVGLSNVVFLTRLHSLLLAEGTFHNHQIITIPFSQTNDADNPDWDALRMIRTNSLVFVPSLWFRECFDFLTERNCRVALLSPSVQIVDLELPDTQWAKLYLAGDGAGLLTRELLQRGARKPAIVGKFLVDEPNFSAEAYRRALQEFSGGTITPRIWDGPFVDCDHNWERLAQRLREFQCDSGFDSLLIDIPVTATPDLRYPLSKSLQLSIDTMIVTRWEYDWSHLLQPAPPYITYDFRLVVRDALQLLRNPPEHYTMKCYEPFVSA